MMSLLTLDLQLFGKQMAKTAVSPTFHKVGLLHFSDKAGHYTSFCILKITSIINISFNGIKIINQKYQQQSHLTSKIIIYLNPRSKNVNKSIYSERTIVSHLWIWLQWDFINTFYTALAIMVSQKTKSQLWLLEIVMTGHSDRQLLTK